MSAELAIAHARSRKRLVSEQSVVLQFLSERIPQGTSVPLSLRHCSVWVQLLQMTAVEQVKVQFDNIPSIPGALTAKLIAEASVLRSPLVHLVWKNLKARAM
jgi:hypothetical protein